MAPEQDGAAVAEGAHRGPGDLVRAGGRVAGGEHGAADGQLELFGLGVERLVEKAPCGGVDAVGVDQGAGVGTRGVDGQVHAPLARGLALAGDHGSIEGEGHDVVLGGVRVGQAARRDVHQLALARADVARRAGYQAEPHHLARGGHDLSAR